MGSINVGSSQANKYAFLHCHAFIQLYAAQILRISLFTPNSVQGL